MKRLAIALALAIAIAVPAASALANSITTDSFGCAWTGETYLGSGSIVWGDTHLEPASCGTHVVLWFAYKQNGTCHYTGAFDEVNTIVSRNASASGATSSHQIYVPGNGYGQIITTDYPSAGVC